MNVGSTSTAIALVDLQEMAERGFGVLVKAVVDVERGVMVVDALVTR